MKNWLLFVITLSLSSQVTCKEWTNWLGNQSCRPVQYYEPKNLNELSDCIKRAADDGYKIRAVGGGFSISDLVCTDGCLINLKNLNKILSIDFENKLVRVEAGISISELNDSLAQIGLALSNQAAISHITLGGAIATAAHGTGHTGSFSSFIREMDLVTADGALHILSAVSDEESFSAAQTNLGALGVVYATTLQCESLYYLREDRYLSDIDTVIEKYKELNETHDFFKFIWCVESGKVINVCWNRIDAHKTLSPEGKIYFKYLNYHTLDENDKDLFSEIAIPIDLLAEAVSALKPFIARHQAQGIPIADIVVRFVKADAYSYLSPAASQTVAYITMSAPANSPLSFYQEFEELMLKLNGRPHWGKINFLNHEKVLKLYGSNLEKFIQVKERLDPQNVFSNTFIDKVCKR